MKKVKGLRSTDWLLRNSPGDAKCSMGSVVDNTLIPVYGARWGWDLSDDHSVSYGTSSHWGEHLTLIEQCINMSTTTEKEE